MVINCDFMDHPTSVAEVIAKAYFEKFAAELTPKKTVIYHAEKIDDEVRV